MSPSPQVSTAAASLSLSDSCEGTYDHLTSAADLVNRIVDGNGTGVTADEFRNAASALTAAKARAPQVLHADLQAMSDALTGMATSVTSGGTIRGNDLADPADRYLAICTGEASGADESESSPPEPEPVRYSKNENRYLKAYAKDWDEDVAPDDALKDGRKACTKIKKKNAGFTRNRYLVNSNNDVDLAVKYLCPRYKSDLQTSKRAIYEGDYEVGSEVKAGTYRSEPKARDCYWERTTKGGDILANDFVTYASGGVTVTIRASDGGFSTKGCGPLIPTS